MKQYLVLAARRLPPLCTWSGYFSTSSKNCCGIFYVVCGGFWSMNWWIWVQVGHSIRQKIVKVANDTARQSKPMAQPPSRLKTPIVTSTPQLLEAKIAPISLMCWLVGLVGVLAVSIDRSLYVDKGQKLEDFKDCSVLKRDLLWS